MAEDYCFTQNWQVRYVAIDGHTRDTVQLICSKLHLILTVVRISPPTTPWKKIIALVHYYSHLVTTLITKPTKLWLNMSSQANSILCNCVSALKGTELPYINAKKFVNSHLNAPCSTYKYNKRNIYNFYHWLHSTQTIELVWTRQKDGQFENNKETIGLGARGEEKERKASNVDERHSGGNAAKAFGGRRVGR